MTDAPSDLLAVQRYARDKTGQGWASLGIIHSTPQGGGYHEGEDLLIRTGTAPGPQYPGSDYSYTDSSRDLLANGRLAGGNYASAFDFGGAFPRFLEFNAWMRQRMLAGDPRTADIREMIHTLDGRTVRRIDRTGRQRDGGDDSHLSHTHFSFFRDSLGRRDRDDNFLGLLKEFFDDAPTTEVDVDSEQARRLTNAEEYGYQSAKGLETIVVTGGDGKRLEVPNVPMRKLNELGRKVDALATPPPAQVTLLPEQLTQVVGQLTAELAPLLEIARKIANG